MIIFDLDGTLADCEHRRHFVDHRKDQTIRGYVKQRMCDCEYPHEMDPWIEKETGKKWKPDWKSFYEACDKDKPIEPVIKIITQFILNDGMEERFDIRIWSGRCESVREKTLKWLSDNIEIYAHYEEFYDSILKMRPIGDSTPDDVLKERWLDEVIEQGNTIDFVFDDRKKVCNMWRRLGIFVFNCCQHDEEF